MCLGTKVYEPTGIPCIPSHISILKNGTVAETLLRI